MNEFKTFHPFANFAYFAATIGLCVFLTDPICTVVALSCAFVYSAMLGGKKRLAANLVYLTSIMAITTFVNFLLSHRGATILKYLPSGNPLTLESLVYGAVTSMVFAAVICLFQCFGNVMTSDKFMYLFGKITPSLSLILSMTLRFVSKFKRQAESILTFQKTLPQNPKKSGILRKAKNGITALSALTTWSLETAVDTAESMKSRGYGISNRTVYSPFEFDGRDAVFLTFVFASTAYITVGAAKGALDAIYYPTIKFSAPTPYNLSVKAVYSALYFAPIVIEIKEALHWKKLKSKI